MYRLENVMNRNQYRAFGKRIVDLMLTVPTLIVLSPFFGAIALLVGVKLGSPVLFRQIRLGLHEKPFTILKFRTMTDARVSMASCFLMPKG